MPTVGAVWSKVRGDANCVGWHERPESYRKDRKTFWMRHVLSGDISFPKAAEIEEDPPKMELLSTHNRTPPKRMLCRKTDSEEWERLVTDKHTREKMQLVEVPGEDGAAKDEADKKRVAANEAKKKDKQRVSRSLKRQSLNPRQQAKRKTAPKATDKTKEPSQLANQGSKKRPPRRNKK